MARTNVALSEDEVIYTARLQMYFDLYKRTQNPENCTAEYGKTMKKLIQQADQFYRHGVVTKTMYCASDYKNQQ